MLKKLSQLLMRAGMIATAALSCGLSTTANALSYTQISQVYFFGDSLTDSGFNDLWPGLPSGKAPTFTTFGGYTWSQYVARDIKGFVLPIYPGPSPTDTITNNGIETVPSFVSGTLHGINYAAAGSTTNSTGNGETWAPSLVQQVQYYLGTHNQAADPNALYFVWSGANDLLILLANPASTQAQLLQAANTASINVANQVATLAARGARRIVVLSLPNIGYTPALQAQGAAAMASAKNLTFTYNSMLNIQLGRVIAQYGTKILYVDVYDLLNNVILAAQAGQPYSIAGQTFRFTNFSLPACGASTQAISCPSGTPSGYIFADTIHPTDMAHRVLSLQVETLIQNWQ